MRATRTLFWIGSQLRGGGVHPPPPQLGAPRPIPGVTDAEADKEGGERGGLGSDDVIKIMIFFNHVTGYKY